MAKLSVNAQVLVKNIKALDVWKDKSCDLSILFAAVSLKRDDFDNAVKELVDSGKAKLDHPYIILK